VALQGLRLGPVVFNTTCTGCYRDARTNFDRELLASCRARKGYWKNSISKNKIRFNMIYKGVFLKCAEILPTRLWDNVED
jgi:hypothetical protein